MSYAANGWYVGGVSAALFFLLGLRYWRSSQQQQQHRYSIPGAMSDPPNTVCAGKLGALVEHLRTVTALLVLAALVITCTLCAEGYVVDSRTTTTTTTAVVATTTIAADFTDFTDSNESKRGRGWRLMHILNPPLFFVLGCACHLHPHVTTALASAHACVLCLLTTMVVGNDRLVTFAWWASCFTLGACALCDLAEVAVRKCVNITGTRHISCGMRREQCTMPLYDCVACFEPIYLMHVPPCGHASMCTSCANKVTECPLCRAPINRPLQPVYLP